MVRFSCVVALAAGSFVAPLSAQEIQIPPEELAGHIADAITAYGCELLDTPETVPFLMGFVAARTGVQVEGDWGPSWSDFEKQLGAGFEVLAGAGRLGGTRDVPALVGCTMPSGKTVPPGAEAVIGAVPPEEWLALTEAAIRDRGCVIDSMRDFTRSVADEFAESRGLDMDPPAGKRVRDAVEASVMALFQDGRIVEEGTSGRLTECTP